MHQRSIGSQRGNGIGDCRQVLIRHVDQVERLQGGDLVHGGHGRHGLPDIAHFVEGKKALVLHGTVAEAGIGDITPRDHGPYPGQVLRAGRIDVQDAGMRFRRL